MKIRAKYQVVRDSGRVPRLVGTPITVLRGYGIRALLMSASAAGVFEDPQAKEKR